MQPSSIYDTNHGVWHFCFFNFVWFSRRWFDTFKLQTNPRENQNSKIKPMDKSWGWSGPNGVCMFLNMHFVAAVCSSLFYSFGKSQNHCVSTMCPAMHRSTPLDTPSEKMIASRAGTTLWRLNCTLLTYDHLLRTQTKSNKGALDLKQPDLKSHRILCTPGILCSRVYARTARVN